MSEVRLLVGGEFFRDIREGHYYYVDKTKCIEEIVQRQIPVVSLFTRPRRFGKTLTMDMLDEFFNIEKDSADLFSGLYISHNEELCSRWLNQYPVLRITLKGMTGLSYAQVLSHLRGELQNICINSKYLFDSDAVDNDDIETLRKIKSKKISDEELADSLAVLIRTYEMHW